MQTAGTTCPPFANSQMTTMKTNKFPIYSLFAANAISMVGNVLANVAIPWFVLQTTGSATQTGITGFFTILPVVIAGLLGGALIDRLGYKPTSIIADIASGLAVALIPIFYFTIGLPFWLLMALVFLGALLDAPGNTARASMIPELAELAGMPIERAASANQIVERSSRLIGAPLAGLLIAFIGTANVLWFDAISFFVSAGIVTWLVAAPRIKSQARQRGKYLQETLDGFRAIRKDAVILAIVIVVMITNFLDAGWGGVIEPYYVKVIFDSPLSLGILIAASGAGSVVGALIFGAIGHRLSRRTTFTAGFTLTALRFFLFAFYLPLPALVVGIFITSIGSGPLNPIIDSVSYERIPSQMRGRIFGAIQAGAWVAMPLGVLLGGVLTEAIGLTPLLIAMGILYLATTLSIALIPAMRGMDKKASGQTAH
jgi:MFS family permease